MSDNTSENIKTPEFVEMSSKVKFYRYLALFSHISLLVWMSVWYFVLADTQAYSTSFIIILYILPLVFPLYGIVRKKPYTHAWSCFVVLWYFLHGITTIYAEPTYLIHASLELVLAIAMFVGCSMFARLRGQELGIGLPKLSKVMEQEKALFEGSDERN